MSSDSDVILHGPPMAGDEVATLLGSLERQRRTFAWKCGSVDAAGLHATLGPSAVTLGGLLSLRRLLIDMIEEHARHVGHADLIREAADALVGEDPPE
jgi:hypothetical protein